VLSHRILIAGGRLLHSLRIPTGAVVAATLVILAGCASGGGADKTDRNVINEAEIEAVEMNTSALHLIQRLRPQWLRGRGPTGTDGSTAPILVYLNHQRIGGLDMLQRYAAREIRELRYLDSISATQLFGTGHRSGAIVIVAR
jgi:hypothetical protein